MATGSRTGVSLQVIRAWLMLGLMLLMPGLAMASGPVYVWEQEHYRWRNDDGGESTATWKAAQDAPVTGVARGQNIRLRFAVANTATNASGSMQVRLEYSTSSTGPWSQVQAVNDGTTPFGMTVTAGYADGTSTTDQLPGTGSFVAGRAVESPANTAASVTYAASQRSNYEFCFQPTAKARGSTAYYFRLSNMGVDFSAYDKIAQLTMAAGEANVAPAICSPLTLTCSGAVNYQIVATGSEPITYGAANLPAGLTMSGSVISGTPSVRGGTYNVTLSAVNAFGSDSKTLVISVPANNVPVAQNSGPVVVAGGSSDVYCQLPVVHSDSSQTLTIIGVTPPQHGSVRYEGGAAYYTPDPRFAGADSFTWKCFDGVDYSGVATVTLSVQGVAPATSSQAAYVAKNTATDIPPLFTGGGGYTNVITVTAAPSHGTLVLANGVFRYTPQANYVGNDSFNWRIMYGLSSPTSASAQATCSIVVKDAVVQADWPQWRYDANRSGISLQTVPSKLYQQWRRDLPAPAPAWPGSQYMDFDETYRPVVMGKLLFVGMNANDSLTAYNTDTGAQVWRFYAGGPVRCAPVAVNGKVYFGSDDGYFYCLNAADGAVAWKFRAGPSERKVMGNNRLISVWPVRGGVVYKDGKVYFGAGVWTLEGQMMYCLDAATGAVVWQNREINAMVNGMSHTVAAPRGFPSLGHLSFYTNNTVIFAPTGNNAPAQIDPLTGKVVYFAWGARGGAGGSGRNGWYVDPASGWTTASEPMSIISGGQTFTAASVAGLGVGGTVGSLLTGDGKLFVVTCQGGVYCFGGNYVASPTVYPLTPTALPYTSDSWNATAQTMLSRGDLKEGLALVWGIGSGRLVEELAKQTTTLMIVAADSDPAKVAALRAKFDAAGLYGKRVAALVGNPLDSGFAPHQAGLIVSEDAAVAGIAAGQDFAKKLYRSTRPFGGEVWLPTTAAQHTSFTGWVAADTNMTLCTVLRNGNYTQMKRSGLTVAQAKFTPPMGILWYNSDYVANYASRGRVGSADLYTCLPMMNDTPGSEPPPPALNNQEGTVNGGTSYTINGTNAVYLVGENRSLPWGYGCDAGRDYGTLHIERSGGVGFFDREANLGVSMVSDARPTCTTTSIYAGNGVVFISRTGMGGCNCNYTMNGSSFGLMAMGDQEVENWFWWSDMLLRTPIHEIAMKKVAVNFGAPGDRMGADDRQLWVHQPKPTTWTFSPAIPVVFRGNYSTHYNHLAWLDESPDRTGDADRRWVSASYVSGMNGISVETVSPVVALRAASAPVVNGVLNDACWTEERRIYMPNYPQHTVRMRYDNNNLYVASEQPTYASGSWRGFWAKLKNRDNTGTTVTLGMKGDGSLRSDGITSTVWQVAWSTNGTTFAGEMAIPWSALASAGLVKEKLLANFAFVDVGTMSVMLNREWIQMGNGGTYLPTAPDQMNPLFFDAPGGVAATPRNYLVKLYFAEMEGKTLGQRVFDVKLQGQTVLSNFDIVRETGGANRDVVKVFPNVGISDNLNIDFVAKAGEPVISGVEIIEQTGGNQPPSVSITSPATGSAFTVPATITINASASDIDGTIAKVEFYNGTTKIGEDAASPYSCIWSSVPAGTYQVTAKAIDNGNAATLSAAVSLTVNGAAVAPSITAGPQNVSVSAGQTATFGVTASGTAPLTYQWRKNGANISGATAASYTTPATAAGDNGAQFSVVVGNSVGSVTSGVVVLTVTAPNAAPTVATAAAATLPTVKTAALSVLGADDGGEAALTYTWATTGTPPAPVTFSVNGANAAKNTTATFTKAGSYTLQATIRDAGGQTVASAVTVTVNPVVTAVTVSPATATISNGATQQFAAAAADQFGAAMSATFSWTISGGGSINSASGLFTATTAGGPFTVTATAAGRSATASVSVTAVVAGQVAWWKFDETTGAAADSSGNGHTAALQGGAVFAAGGKQGNALQLFDADDKAVANPVAPLAASWTVAAWFTAPLPATATWHTLTRSQASYGDHHIITDASLNLGMYDNVTAGQFRSCGYNLAGLSAGWHHVTAVGSGTTTKYYIDGVLVGTSDRKGTGDVCYIGNDPAGGIGQRFSDKIDDVRVYNYAMAQAEITALAGVVPNPAPTVATAAAATLPTVKTAALSVLGADDGGEAALTYTWATTGTPPAPVTFSVNGANAAKNTTATFTKAGSYTLQATIRDAGGQTVASAVTVTVNPVVTAVSVTPATASIVNGSTQPFAAVAADQFGAAMSAIFSWTVSGGGSINSSGGQFTATTVGGPFTVTATAGGRSGTASVTVLKPGSALVVHWKLDEASGTAAADSSGLTNTGVVAGGATWVAGRTNGAVKLDGVDDAVTLGSVKGLATGSKAHSVAGWIKMNALPSTRAWILQLGNDGSGSHHWLIDRTGKTQFGVWNGAQLQPVLTTGRWTHVAMTYDGTNLVGYVDGTRIGSAAAGFNLQGIPLTVGSPRLSENAFNGTMDDVRVYSRALSAAEVASLVGGVNVTALGMETMPAGGTVQSASASVAVVAEGVRNTEEAGFLLSFQGVQGNSYVVEYTDDLMDPAGWHVLSTNTCTSSGTMEVTDPSGGANRFYRIMNAVP